LGVSALTRATPMYGTLSNALPGVPIPNSSCVDALGRALAYMSADAIVNRYKKSPGLQLRESRFVADELIKLLGAVA
jgi:hypothetical protein